jgi:hypothetical protein
MNMGEFTSEKGEILIRHHAMNMMAESQYSSVHS